jgi:TRAP-type mannitol/chloroaromatic compound transport system permease small subunit
MRNTVQTIIGAIDRFTQRLGSGLSWLGLAMMLVTVLVVFLRYGFDIGWIAMQETVLYLHAAIFMLGMSYTLKHDGHVRVDVFYRNFSKRGQAWVNLMGFLFLLLPICLFIGFISFEYVQASWSLKETSAEAGGLPWVYLLKSLILLMVGALMLQGVAEFLRSLSVILGWTQEPGEATDG